MKIIKYSLICGLLIAGMSSCKKDGFTPLTDNRPPIPVTVANATALRPAPAILVSEATNTFTIELQIPESSGRKIKEISKVILSANPGGILLGSTASYKPVPIAGTNSNKISFSTSLTEMASKGVNKPVYPPGIPVADYTSFFFFLLTLDDNSTLITQQVRVLMQP